jgi:hypothetical protein
MKVRYKFVVDDDVKVNHAEAGFLVMAYLNSPDGWSKYGYVFEPVKANEKVLIRLSSSKTIKKICGLPDKLSCAEVGGKHMYLNAERWLKGSSKSKLSLVDYRQYMVSHEMGHILGYKHSECPCNNCPAPIMMQQTLGIGKCRPNAEI